MDKDYYYLFPWENDPSVVHPALKNARKQMTNIIAFYLGLFQSLQPVQSMTLLCKLSISCLHHSFQTFHQNTGMEVIMPFL